MQAETVITLHNLTPYQQAENPLHRQNLGLDDEALREIAPFKTLMSNLPGIVYRSRNDRDWTKEWVSEGCYQLTGYCAAEIIGNKKCSYAQLIHPEDRELVWNQVQSALQENRAFQICYRITTAGGEEKWVWEQGRGVFSESGEVVALEGFITDITGCKRAEEEIRLLQTISQACADAEDFHTALEVALGKVCEATGWNYGEAWIPCADGTVLECSQAWYSSTESLEPFRRHSQAYTFAPGIGLPGRVWLSQQPEWIPDVSTTSDSLFNRTQIAQECRLRSGFGVPIFCNSQVLAVLMFFMFESRQKDSRLVDLVGCVAAQLGNVMQRKQAEVALRQAEAKYRSIFENAIEGIFQTTADGNYISANPSLARLYGYSSPQELMAGLTDIENQLYVEPGRRAEFIRLLQENDAVSEFESQVYRQDGSTIWISENARAVLDDTGALLYYEGTVEDITERKQVAAQLHERAFYDILTGLPNRALFMEHLQYALDRAQQCQEYKFAVLFLDLDGFKVVNDSLGHLVGDKLLIAIARRLEACLRSGDTVARLGGDEFTILLENIQDINNATIIAERIHRDLGAPFNLDGHEVFTAASIGIVLSWSQDRQAEDLLRDADTALYRAKTLGKGCHQVFDIAMLSEEPRF